MRGIQLLFFTLKFEFNISSFLKTFFNILAISKVMNIDQGFANPTFMSEQQRFAPVSNTVKVGAAAF
jgi:hypothetical protein